MSLNKIEKALVGGVDELAFVPVEGIDSLNVAPGQVGGPSAILLKAGYDWINVPGIQGTMRYSEQQQLSNQGLRYAKEAVALLPHDDFENQNLLHSYIFTPLILKYRDHTGNLKICGTKEEPFRLKFDFSTAEFAGQIGFSLSFTGLHSGAGAYALTGDAPLIWINEDGKIEISPALVGIISMNSDGKLVANGSDAASYSLSANGFLVYS